MAAKARKLTDRRVERTRRALTDALISLMTERGWDNVNVQDICDLANIGRSTFYLHFQNKDELLDEGFKALRRALRTHLASSAEEGKISLPFVRGLIDHVFEQKRLFRAMIGSRGGHVVRTRFRGMIFELVADEVALLAEPSWRRDTTTHYVTGALFELLVWLSDARRVAPADEIHQQFQRVMTPVLDDLKRQAPCIFAP